MYISYYNYTWWYEPSKIEASYHSFQEVYKLLSTLTMLVMICSDVTNSIVAVHLLYNPVDGLL